LSGGVAIPALSASASENDDRRIHVSLTNIDPEKERKVRVELRGVLPKSVTGQIINAADMRAHNTFENPDTVQIGIFSGAVISGNAVMVSLPSKSLVTLEIV
jgi:alpha-N-arabinofuranosidase